VIVRPALPSDVDALAALHVAAWRETFAGVLSQGYLDRLDVEARRQMWRTVIGAPGRRSVVAVPEESDGVEAAGRVPVGFAATRTASTGPRPLELWGIYLLSRWHGSGAGQALLDAAIGAGPCFLWTSAANRRAQAFYRRNRFVPDGATETVPEWEGMEIFRFVR
jgi:ribosomal protein S18 acetylase RimI-like enzyme